LTIIAIAIACASCLTLSRASGAESSLLSLTADGYQIVERAMDSARFERTSVLTNDQGTVILQTNRFTVLGHGLHYPDPVTGQWRESEELVEAHPDGAVARRGAYQTIFSADVASDTVFDILTPDQKRLRGGPRLLLLSDPKTGRSITLGKIKSSQGEILPPNEVLYRGCFEGIEADVAYVWKKGGLSQNVLLREAPVVPEGWSADSRIEVVTEFVEAPQADVRAQVVKAQGLPDRVDAGFIVFGWMAAVPGVAYAVEGGANLTGPGEIEGGSVPVAKEWVAEQADVGALLIESVSYRESAEYLRDLPKLEARVETGDRVVEERRVALARAGDRKTAETLEARIRAGAPRRMQLAAASATIPRGYLIDAELSGTVASKTFLHYTGSDGTYSICTSYTVTSSATFNDGAIVKYANNAYLQLSGSVSAPAYGLVQLTSIHDDSVGATISTGNCTSIGDPFTAGQTALHALRIYGPSASTTLRNFRICFAKTGVNYYSSLSHTMEKMRFEHCQTGVSAYAASVTISNVVQCDTYVLTSNQGGGASFTTSNVSTDCAFYVAPTGDDNNLATIGSPWKTLTKAKQVSGPKVTVILRAGTYAENIAGDWYGGLKSWSYPSTLKGYAGERPVLKPNAGASQNRVITLGDSLSNRIPHPAGPKQKFIIVENLVLDGYNLRDQPGSDGVKITDGAYAIRLKNCEIRNVGNQGVLVSNDAQLQKLLGMCEFSELYVHDWGDPLNTDSETPAHHRHAIYLKNPSNVVERCHLANGPGGGVHIYQNGTNNFTNVVRNCYLDRCATDPQASAIFLTVGHSHQVFNNIIRRSVGKSIFLAYGVYDSLVAFNTLVENSGCGNIYFNYDAGTGCRILNNLVANNTGIGIHLSEERDPQGNVVQEHGPVEVKNNLCFNNGLPHNSCSLDCATGANFQDDTPSATVLNGNLGLFDCGPNPLFVSPGSLDFHLQSGSPALGAALGIASITMDYSGPMPSAPSTYSVPVTRGSPPDIGAYERP
jgi:hypothetical protein